MSAAKRSLDFFSDLIALEHSEGHLQEKLTLATAEWASFVIFGREAKASTSGQRHSRHSTCN